MKAQSSPLDKDMSISSIQTHKRLSLFENVQIKCIKGRQAAFYCTQCDCHPVICQTRECACFNEHAQCQYFQKTSTLHNWLDRKLIQNSDIQWVSEMTNQMINVISELQKQTHDQFNYFGLSNAEEKIAKNIIGPKQSQNFSGYSFKNFREERQHEQDWFNTSVEKFSQILKESQQKICSIYSTFEKRIYFEHLKQIQQASILKMNSQILRTQEEKKILQIFFDAQSPKLLKIETVKFDDENEVMSKFKELFENCNNRFNILFIIENTNGKKFGGYTRCKFDKDSIKFKQDRNLESFIFSIDKCYKQYLKKNSLFMSCIENNQYRISLVSANKVVNGQIQLDKNSLRIFSEGCSFIQIDGKNIIELNGSYNNMKEFNIKHIQVFQVFNTKDYTKDDHIEQMKLQQKIAQNSHVFEKNQKQQQIFTHQKKKNQTKYQEPIAQQHLPPLNSDRQNFKTLKTDNLFCSNIFSSQNGQIKNYPNKTQQIRNSTFSRENFNIFKEAPHIVLLNDQAPLNSNQNIFNKNSTIQPNKIPYAQSKNNQIFYEKYPNPYRNNNELLNKDNANGKSNSNQDQYKNNTNIFGPSLYQKFMTQSTSRSSTSTFSPSNLYQSKAASNIFGPPRSQTQKMLSNNKSEKNL